MSYADHDSLLLQLKPDPPLIDYHLLQQIHIDNKALMAEISTTEYENSGHELIGHIFIEVKKPP